MRLQALAVGIAIILVLPATGLCAGLATGIDLGPPTIMLEPAEVLQVTRSCTVSLPAGESIFALPASDLGVDPAGAQLVVAPADVVRVAAMEIPAGGATVQWRLEAARPVEATVDVTCGLKGLAWSIHYEATLNADGDMDLRQLLTITNGLGRSFDEVTLTGPVSAVMPLREGERVTRSIMDRHIGPEFVKRSIIYDKARHGDVPVEMLTIVPPHPVRRGPLLDPSIPIIGRLFSSSLPALQAGSVSIRSDMQSGGELIGSASIPYTPTGEPIEIKLGPAAGILVTRALELTKDVNVRKDAHGKTAVLDKNEEWVIEVRNLRRSPVELAIIEHPEGTWQVQRANLDSDKPDATTLAFDVSLEAEGVFELIYTLRRQNLQP